MMLNDDGLAKDRFKKVWVKLAVDINAWLAGGYLFRWLFLVKRVKKARQQRLAQLGR